MCRVAAFVAYVSAVHMGNHRPELKAEYAIRATHYAFHLRVLLGGLFGVQTTTHSQGSRRDAGTVHTCLPGALCWVDSVAVCC
jgi:hypothetical protein